MTQVTLQLGGIDTELFKEGTFILLELGRDW